MSQLANRYATALFELAVELHKVDHWQQQMKSVRAVFAENKEIYAFFRHYRIADVEKKSVLTNVFINKLDKEVMNFLQLLIDRKRISAILVIVTAFNTLCNQSKNIQEGYVYSVRLLSEQEKRDIEIAVGKSLQCNVELSNKIDASLLQGVKVVVGDQVIDGSLRYRMNALKTELLKESRW